MAFLDRFRDRRRLAVVLGGGGNLGAFEVGVVDVMAARGIVPDLLVGTSVGAINAAFWAFNPDPEAGAKLLEIWRQAARQPLLRGGRIAVLRRLIGRANHLFGAETLSSLVHGALPGPVLVEEAEIPLAIAVTEAATGERRVLRSGALHAAVLASSAVPGVFPPVVIDGVSYMDGGVVANLDLDSVVEAGIGQALAVDVMGVRTEGDPADLWEMLQRSVVFALRRQADLNARAVAGRLRVAVLRPRMPSVPLLGDFRRMEDMVDWGRRAAERFLAGHFEPGGRVRPGVMESEQTASLE
jgi:NTE family protein